MGELNTWRVPVHSEPADATTGRIRANARGFRDLHAFITMIMLKRGGLGPDLPWATAS